MKYQKIASLLLAGSFFLGSCGGGRLKRGVTVNGLDVGGMSQTEALERVREHLERLPLTVVSPAGEFALALDYADDGERVLKEAKKAGNYTVSMRRECVLLESFADMVCLLNAKEGKDARLEFDAAGFTYVPEEMGVACDRAGLIEDVSRALRGKETRVSLVTREVAPDVTVEELRARTQLLAAFSTKFDAGNGARSHNIALAASHIAGTVVGSGQTFSFNARVGARTAENGFEEAAVIQDGEFVSGVGGGVCQTSTTLFGAALRAGLTIEESHPHSLSVGYVPPSQDAMVSSYSDLKFTNPYAFPVYILAAAEAGEVRFEIYGLPDGRRYEVESRVLFRLDPPSVKIVEGTANRIVRQERAGLCSESYLSVYEGERLLTRALIRRDTYACVQGIEERVPMPPTPQEILEGMEEEGPPENGEEQAPENEERGAEGAL